MTVETVSIHACSAAASAGLAREGLLARLVPADVVTRESTVELVACPRFDVEEAAVATAVGSRQREFRTTRTCARLALHELGFRDVALPRRLDGSPVWPASVVGSLTHCLGFRAAAVGWRRDYRGVGIDAEPSAPLPPDVLALVADPLERTRIAWHQNEDPSVPWDRLLFSAKESVYKARFPLTGQWLDFADVHVVLDHVGGFSARVHSPRPIRSDGIDVVHGRWAVAGGILATAVIIDR